MTVAGKTTLAVRSEVRPVGDVTDVWGTRADESGWEEQLSPDAADEDDGEGRTTE